MACGCAKNNKVNDNKMIDDATVEPIAVTADTVNQLTSSTPTAKAAVGATRPLDSSNDTVSQYRQPLTESEREALEIALEQCYLCTKKHVVRAQEFFQEYHTGYQDHIKNLVQSVKVAEIKVRQAFLLYQRTMGQLNMAEGELLGKEPNKLGMREEHISLANRIRAERLKLSDNPLYVPDFDQLLVDINILQYRVMETVKSE